MRACPVCQATLENPLVCTACGALMKVEREPTPFEVFGIEPVYALDTAALRKRLLALSRRVHPDYFGTQDATLRELAERHSARLNQAFEILADDFARADLLVSARGGPSEQNEREMPRAFLMEVLEWNETLEQARTGAGSRAALDALEQTLSEQRADTFQEIGTRLADEVGTTESLIETRRLLNVARYIDRALTELGALRLAQATAR